MGAKTTHPPKPKREATASAASLAPLERDTLIASWEESLATLSCALAAGADPNSRHSNGSTLALRAAARGNLDCLRALVAAGADLDAMHPEGFSAAMDAAANGREACLRELILAGAGLDHRTKFGWTALGLAVRNGHEACVRALAEAGASLRVECPAFDGTAAELAASQERSGLARWLRDAERSRAESTQIEQSCAAASRSTSSRVRV